MEEEEIRYEDSANAREKEENERRLEGLREVVNEQESRLQNLQSTAFRLANYYFVFQGVILTAICNGSTSLKCSDRWFLFCISLLAATLNLVALSIIGLKYLRNIEQRDQNWRECNLVHGQIYLQVRSAQTQRAAASSPNEHRQINIIQSTLYDDPFKRFKRKVCFICCMFLFLCFASIMLAGCWFIVCRKDESEDKNDQCIKLCRGAKCVSICTEY